MVVDLRAFAQRIINQVHDKWLALGQREHIFELGYCRRNGFRVFYSPVTIMPRLMILGFNPGGGPSSFNEEKACNLPDDHDYFPRTRDDDYPLARRMREDLFSGNQALLRESVKTNLIPFRSRNKDEWYRIEKKLRVELEEFSREVCREVVEVMKPRFVLLEGVQTFDLFCRWFAEEILPPQSSPNHQLEGGRRIYCRAEMRNGIKVMGVLHLSGARPGSQEIECIKNKLMQEIDLHMK